MRITFRIKLLGLVAIAALALVVLVVADTFADRSVNRHLVNIQQQFLPKVGLAPELEGQLERITRSLQDAAAASDQDLLAASRKQKEAFMARLAAARSALEPAEAAGLEVAVEAYYGAAERVTGRLIAGETGEDLVDEMSAMQERHAQAIDLLRQATAFDEASLTAAFAAATSAQQTASRIRLAVSLACLLLVIVLSLWFSRGVIRSLAGLTAGFERFGEGDFERPIPVTSGDELGDVANRANEMARSLERLHAASTRGDWQKGGRAGLAQELRGELEPEEVADRSVAFLARYLGAPLGALYYRESDGALGLLGRYAPAAAPGVAPAPRFRHGEGLVGQAALGSEISVIESPSEGHLRIRSGLAEGSPRAVVFLPLVHLGRVTGVIELAVLAPWTEEAAELLLSVRDTVAIAIEVAIGRSATRALLAETHQQNAELEDARRRLEQKADELATASAYKSQFLASMSHELRTPLNAILGFAELIHDGAVSPDSPQHKEFLGDILSSGRHLLQLINDVPTWPRWRRASSSSGPSGCSSSS
jgi:GAF domain-containing protein/HAMP domain-containing protein